MKGFDCATQLTHSLASVFKADGYEFVIRYLSDGWKGITKNEADMLRGLGFEIGSVFERAGQREDINRSIGLLDGQMALNFAKVTGQPEGSTIYFAVDYEAGPNDMDNIESYLRNAENVIPGYEVGCYGSYAVVEEMHRRGIKHLWQTLAWSYGNVSKYANIIQSDNDVQVHGIGIDNDRSFGGEGWWSSMEEVLKRIVALEELTKALVKTPAPDWFITEFGAHALDGIVNDLTGDASFWRETAIELRLRKKGL